jgi:BolA protein
MSRVEESIREKLTEQLTPKKLMIENVSHHHAGHASSPGTGESHFNVTVISEAFEGLRKVERFRLVHRILKEEMEGPVHALSLDLKSPAEV